MEESPVVPQAPEAAATHDQSATGPMDVEAVSSKRDGPDTRTVVLGPEGKKQRTSFALPSSEYMAETFLSMHRSQHLIQTEDDPLDLPDHHFIEYKPKNVKDELFYMSSHGWYADLYEGSIFRVDTTTDNISEDDVFSIWPQVEEGDHKEVSQFVEQQAFSPVRLSDLGKDVAIIDAIWVRKWKKAVEGRIVKSRLCARGCHDPCKNMMSNRSTAATRLCQRLILMSAVNVPQKILESWDVAGAFLKGLTYDALWKGELGLNTVERMIAIIPPLNVWRHLRKLSKKFAIPESELHLWALLCLKPVYGLSEAPLAWQLFLHKYLRELGGRQSHFDECYWYWPAPKPGAWPLSSITTHVDDLAVEGFKQWLDEVFQRMVKKFGKLTRQTLPFSHCGCRYSSTSDGFRVDQEEYVSQLKPVVIDSNDADDRSLTSSETTTLRSAIGALMWTGITRPDLLAELSALQGIMNKGKVKHLKEVNLLIARAKRDKEAAIHYRPLRASKCRIVVVHDASAASSTRNYAQEGVMVFLMADLINTNSNHIVVDDDFAKNVLSGCAQLLHMQSARAKRVSYSTSHGETLAAINGLECARLVSTRLSEITYGGVQPTIRQLLAVQERGSVMFPVDTHTHRL